MIIVYIICGLIFAAGVGTMVAAGLDSFLPKHKTQEDKEIEHTLALLKRLGVRK